MNLNREKPDECYHFNIEKSDMADIIINDTLDVLNNTSQDSLRGQLSPRGLISGKVSVGILWPPIGEVWILWAPLPPKKLTI